MLEKINEHKGLEGYYETVPKTICSKCRWVYLIDDHPGFQDECDMPKVTTCCRVTNLVIRPKCHEVNINGNCLYYERRKRTPWYKILGEFLMGGYGP